MRKSGFIVFIGVSSSAICTFVQAEPLVLNCEIEKGGPAASHPIQIMIDEDAGIVVYNYQLLKGGSHLQKFLREGPLPEGVAREQTIDMSMTITARSNEYLQASDNGGTFVITKHDGKFVKAYALAMPNKDGAWTALGNTHWGKCVRSPF